MSKTYVLVPLLFAACVSLEGVREATTPEGAGYVTGADVRATMQELARGVVRIDEILRSDDEEMKNASQDEITAILESMEVAAGRLASPGNVTNHPLLDRHLDAFLLDVARAKEAAARTPPSYYLAGTIAGSCIACHADRGDFRRNLALTR